MARIFIVRDLNAKPGTTLPGEPLPRPYVVLQDGTAMSHREWMELGRPA